MVEEFKCERVVCDSRRHNVHKRLALSGIELREMPCEREKKRNSPESSDCSLTHALVFALAQFQVIHNLSKLSVREAATVSPGGAFPVIGEMYKDAKGNIINNPGNMPSYTGAFVNSTCSSHM